MVVLRPGEDLATERVRLACGAFAIAALHYQYEQWKEAGRPERHPRIEGWDRYVAMLDATDPERLHQRIHQGHNCWVIDEEWEFVTPELIDATCMVGTAPDLAERLTDLGAAGLSQVMLLPPLAVRDEVLRDVAEHVMPLLPVTRADPSVCCGASPQQTLGRQQTLGSVSGGRSAGWPAGGRRRRSRPTRRAPARRTSRRCGRARASASSPSDSARTAPTIGVTGWCSATGCSQPGHRLDRHVGAGDEHEREGQQRHALGGLGVAGDQAHEDERPRERGRRTAGTAPTAATASSAEPWNRKPVSERRRRR